MTTMAAAVAAVHDAQPARSVAARRHCGGVWPSSPGHRHPPLPHWLLGRRCVALPGVVLATRQVRATTAPYARQNAPIIVELKEEMWIWTM